MPGDDEHKKLAALQNRLEELEERLEDANRRFSLLLSAPAEGEVPAGLVNLLPRILDSLHETVVVILDRDANYQAVWADPKLEERYGVRGEQLRGRSIGLFFPPEEAERLKAKIRKTFDEGVSHREENRIFTNNGVFWHDSVVSPLYDEQGRVVAALLVAQDITRAKNAELSQAESMQHYRAVVEQSPSFIVLHQDQKIVYANPATVRALGAASAEEVVGRPLMELVHPDSRSRVAERVKQMMESGTRAERAELKFLGADGREFLGEVYSQPVDLGGQRAVLSVVHDITERRRLERERAELQQRVNRAEKHRSLALMAMGMAHDFNNLLMGILGNASVLTHDLAKGSPEHELAQRIERSAILAGEITSQLLEFAGRTRKTRQRVDVGAVVEELRDTIESRMPPNLELHWQLQRGLPAVAMNPANLKQLLLNLVDNAADAIGNLAGRIAVKTSLCTVNEQQLRNIFHEHELVAGPVVCLEVSDTGCGMKAETVRQIFDPFFSTKEGNRGLGLAGVLGIVMRCGGAIQVHSQPGHGSTFEIWLPPAEASDGWTCESIGTTNRVTEQEQEKEQENEEKMESNGAGRQILVAEDERVVAEVVAETLRQAGYQPVLVGNGLAACELFAGAPHRFAAAVLDMNMPGRNGVETLAELRRLRRKLPVVLTSGQAEKPLLAGCAGNPPAFLAKPYRPQRLVELLHEMLGF